MIGNWQRLARAFVRLPVARAQLSPAAAGSAAAPRHVDFFQVWFLLMTGNWKRLARAFVRLPGAPQRTDEEAIAFLKTRIQPFPVAGA